MPLKMGSVSKALATGLVLNREQTDDKKIRIRYCRGDDGLDGRQKRELDDEAKRVARKIHHVTKRMDEEEQVKDRIRCKQQEETFAKRCKQDEKRKQEMTRAEKNKEWRMKKEKEGVDVNWRKVEERVRGELCCPSCQRDMAPPGKIYQCRDGHVVCEECWNRTDLKICSACKESIAGRNIAMEKISSLFFNGSLESERGALRRTASPHDSSSTSSALLE